MTLNIKGWPLKRGKRQTFLFLYDVLIIPFYFVLYFPLGLKCLLFVVSFFTDSIGSFLFKEYIILFLALLKLENPWDIW